jgi:hypothetical protein
MTAFEIIHDAAVFCGLAEPPEPAVGNAAPAEAETPAAIEAVGLASLNRWLARLWDAAPNAALRAAVWSDGVSTGQADIVLPAAVDVIQAVLLDGEALPALGPGQRGPGYLPLADVEAGEGGEAGLCRAIRLVPAAVCDAVVDVCGTSRFVPLALDEATGSERLDGLLFQYVVADLFLHIKDFESRKEAIKAAAELKKAWLESATGLPEAAFLHLPERSFHEG